MSTEMLEQLNTKGEALYSVAERDTRGSHIMQYHAVKKGDRIHIRKQIRHGVSTLKDSTELVHSTVQPRMFHSGHSMIELGADGKLYSATAERVSNTGTMAGAMVPCTKDADTGGCIGDSADNGTCCAMSMCYLDKLLSTRSRDLQCICRSRRRRILG